MKVKGADLKKRIDALLALMAYRHPVTKSGLRQDVSVRLIKLRRELSENGAVFEELTITLFKDFGAREVPGGFTVPTTSDRWDDFQKEWTDLQNTEYEVSQVLNLSDLVCRNAQGEYEPIEPPASVLDDLGELLSLEPDVQP